MAEAAQEIIIAWTAKRESLGRRIGARNWAGTCCRHPIGDCLGSCGAAECSCPVNSICLDWVCTNFHQARFDHDLPRWLVDLEQHSANSVDVTACFAIENRVGTLV